jgi:hypothetical protein
MLAHGFTVDFLVELIRTGVRLPPAIFEIRDGDHPYRFSTW